MLERNAPEDISRFNYKYNKLLFYLHVPTTIFHKINYSAEACVCMKMLRERSSTQLKHVFVYEDATREDIISRYPWTSLLSAVSILSYRSVPYFMYWFRIWIFYSDSGCWLYVLGPIMNCMYLICIGLDFINTCNLNFEWSFWAFVLIRLVIQPANTLSVSSPSRFYFIWYILYVSLYFMCKLSVF